MVARVSPPKVSWRSEPGTIAGPVVAQADLRRADRQRPGAIGVRQAHPQRVAADADARRSSAACDWRRRRLRPAPARWSRCRPSACRWPCVPSGAFRSGRTRRRRRMRSVRRAALLLGGSEENAMRYGLTAADPAAGRLWRRQHDAQLQRSRVTPAPETWRPRRCRCPCRRAWRRGRPAGRAGAQPARCGRPTEPAAGSSGQDALLQAAGPGCRRRTSAPRSTRTPAWSIRPGIRRSRDDLDAAARL